MAYSATPAPHAPQPDFVLYQMLMQHAALPHDPATLALAGVIAAAPTRPVGYRQAIRGLSAAQLQALLSRFFPGLDAATEPRKDFSPGSPPQEPPHDPYDEFDDLTALLLANRTRLAPADSSTSTVNAGGPDLVPDPVTYWVAHAIATACKGGNHLWQDLGLPSRDVLNALMQTYFAPLKAKNSGDMKWKKFFYRDLCEQAEVPICKAPSCSVCVDQAACFGQEAGAGFFSRASAAPAPA